VYSKGDLVEIAIRPSYYEHLLKVEFPEISSVSNTPTTAVFKSSWMWKT